MHTAQLFFSTPRQWPRRNKPGARRALGVWLGVFCLAACTPADSPKTPPAKSWREELVVIVPEDEKSADAEFERQLAGLFARQLQVKARLLPLPPDRITPVLMTGKAHVAAAGLRSDEGGGLRFAHAYQVVSEQIVCGGPSPKRADALPARKLAVVAGSAQEAALREAQRKLPALRWEARRNQSVSGLLAEVAAGKLECTVANEEQLALARNFFPGLNASFDIAAPSRLAWAFAPNGNEMLFEEAQKFFTAIKLDGTLRRLLDRHYGHNERLEPVDAVAFIAKLRTDLPHFRSLFEEAELLTGTDWQLLAAISYHESHWNPLATSPTNVRGMMMLTEDTADRMDVANRLDPRQSIEAGARYFQLLKEQLPLRIADEERTWLALAAYNQGMGHLEDARVLTARAGLNPDTWGDVKKMMPLLSQPQYFEQTKHGRARGGEAVIMVETVRLYYDMLKHLNSHEIPQLPPSPFHLKFPPAGKVSSP
ncbi:MAG: membrane-bound lytic murein transglycosylase MltF [Nitrosomonadales bacterium]|nr:membrane-bound lytic murein transglycosylase MltF [Nitrosomonadales bacterium]